METDRPRQAARRWTFLYVLIVVFFGGTQTVRAGTFAIKPYLFSIKGGPLALGWQYKDQSAIPEEGAFVRFFENGIETGRAPAHSDDSHYFAILPVPKCGFGKDVSYEIPGMNGPRHIEEIPCAGSGESARLTFLADTQEGPRHLRRLAEEIEVFPGSAILHGGDFVQTGGRLAEWIDYFGALDPVGGSRVTFPVVGNHEYRRSGEGLWRRFFRFGFREAHYSFRMGPAEIFVVNSCFEDDPVLVETQVRWLQGALARSTADWKIIAFHHAPYSHSVAHHRWAPKKEHLVIRGRFEPHFAYFGVHLVLNGHVHLFERSFKDGVHYLTAGPAGGKKGLPLVRNPYAEAYRSERTVTHIEAGDRIVATTVNSDGDTIDQLVITQSPALD